MRSEAHMRFAIYQGIQTAAAVSLLFVRSGKPPQRQLEEGRSLPRASSIHFWSSFPSKSNHLPSNGTGSHLAQALAKSSFRQHRHSLQAAATTCNLCSSPAAHTAFKVIPRGNVMLQKIFFPPHHTLFSMLLSTTPCFC